MEIIEPQRITLDPVPPLYAPVEGDHPQRRRLRPWLPEVPANPRPPEPYPPDVLAFPPSVENGAAAAYEKFLELFDELRCYARLNKETGLPGYIFGRLRAPDGLSPVDASKDFLTRHELMLAGRREGIRLEVRCVTTWQEGTVQVRLTQTNSHGIAVYGGHIVCTFHASGWLMAVSSSLYPATASELDIGGEPKGGDPARLIDLLRSAIPPEIGVAEDFAISKGLTPTPIYILPVRGLSREEQMSNSRYDGLRWKLVGNDWQQFVDPDLADTADIRGEYRLVEYVPWQDRYDQRWVAFIDPGDGSIAPEVVTYQFDEAYDTKKYVVFRYSGDAFEARKSILDQDAQVLDQLIDARGLRLDLDLGPGVAELRNVDLIEFRGEMVRDPALQADLANLSATDVRRFLAANAYFHVVRAQGAFAGYLAAVRIEAVRRTNGEFTVNPLQGILVELKDENRGSRTRLDEDSKRFNLILTPGSRVSVQFPTFEGGLDADVITHEYTHAVIEHYFAAVFEHGNGNARDTARRGLDEAVAYYFACDLEGNAQWGECAYSEWQSFRQLDAPMVSLQSLPFDPAGVIYSIGLWLAKVLWRLSRDPALEPDFNLVLLQALAGMASVQATTQTPIGRLWDEVQGLFSNLGVHLRDLSRNHDARLRVEKIFRDAGLALD